MISNEDFIFLADKLHNAEFRFAKSMPKMPHFYTLRKNWIDEDFAKVVLLIREHGYKRKWFKTTYIYFNINQHQYWTMGAKIEDTILINKAKINLDSDYDILAKDYDGFYKSNFCLNQNEFVINNKLKDINKEHSILDIGCGTGLFLDYKPEILKYTGVDPSYFMINNLIKKHLPHKDNLTITKFENFYTNEKFDYIISLFGSCSYIDEDSLKRIESFLKPNGKYFLMFYKENYKPFFYGKIITEFKCVLNRMEFKDGKSFVYDDYNVVTNIQ